MSQVQKIIKQNPEFKGIFSGAMIEVEATIANKMSDGRWKVSLPAELPTNLLYLSLDKPNARLVINGEFEGILYAMDSDEGTFRFMAVEPVLFRGISESGNSLKSSSLKTKPRRSKK